MLKLGVGAQGSDNGLWLAAVVLAGLVLVLGYAAVMFARAWRSESPRVPDLPVWLDVAFPILIIAGLGVAGYLTYVETQNVAPVCGPVGDCGKVQSSEYALLLGVLPVGLLGVFGYVAILVAWLWGRLRSDRLADYAPLAVLGLTAFGVAFSIYLTYLEVFVILAVCAWCLTSAVLMAALLLLALPPALATLAPEAEAASS